ncbi:MFS family permease [Kitasatospora sp. MAA19]|uniref:MFS transporter n=1 Tax=Kitasatospora sp. MAA19 TaxID=3035090 RepID=UPI002474404F|nr:MFS transporter [Kitasatospora sp. MAA19]MDH6707888.1 MFS family permease [Kitasatospora sp. MAA19]
MSTSSAPEPRLIPPAGPQRTLAAAQLVSAVGDGAYYTCSALYFTHVVGMSATALGLGLAVAWALGSLAGVPLGHLADRRGPRRTAVALALATAVVVAAFLMIRSYAPFLVAVCLYATTQSGLTAARQALVGALVPPARRTALLAHLQSTLNGGLAVGAAIGGIALAVGTRAAFLGAFAVTALGFLAGALILLRLPEVPPAPAQSGTGPRLAVLRDRRYAAVALVNAVLLLRMPLLSLVIPLWIADRAPGIGWLGSALFVLNTVAVLVFQVRAARGVTGLASAARAVRSAGVVLLASCAVFGLSALDVPVWAVAALLVAASVLQVIGEMRQSAGSWQISFDLAPPERIGQYQGFFGTGVAVARTLGPLLLTTLLLDGGLAGWLVLGGLFLAAGHAMGPVVRWAERDRGHPAPTAPPRPGAAVGTSAAVGVAATEAP